MTTIAVHPASENRRAFGAWAVKRRVRCLAQQGFAVPEELFSQVPTELLIGAKVNGRIYLPAGPLQDVLEPAVPDGGQLTWPSLPPADDLATTGAPHDDSEDHTTSP